MRFAGQGPVAQNISTLLEGRQIGSANDVSDYIATREEQEYDDIEHGEDINTLLATRGKELYKGSATPRPNSLVPASEKYSRADYLSAYAEDLASQGKLDAYKAFQILQAEGKTADNALARRLCALVGEDSLRQVAVLDLRRPWELPEGVAGVGYSSQSAREKLGVVAEVNYGGVKKVQTRESWKGRTRKW